MSIVLDREIKSSKYNIFVEDNDSLLIFNSLTKKTIAICNNNKNRIRNAIESGDYSQLTTKEKDILWQMGVLVDINEDESRTALFEYNRQVYSSSELNLVIIPTMFCNFRCVYCPQPHRLGEMDDTVIESIIKFIKRNTTLNKFTGICFLKDYTREIQDIDYVIGLLALSVREYEYAKKYLRTSFMMDSYIKNTVYEYVTLIIDAISNGISQKETIDVMRSLQVSENIVDIIKQLYNVHNHGYSVFYCGNCNDCQYINCCSYDYWNKLNLHLKDAEQLYNQSNPYFSEFFKSVSKELSI